MKFIFPLYTCISGIKYANLHGTVSMLRTYKLYNYSGVVFFFRAFAFYKDEHWLCNPSTFLEEISSLVTSDNSKK